MSCPYLTKFAEGVGLVMSQNKRFMIEFEVASPLS